VTGDPSSLTMTAIIPSQEKKVLIVDDDPLVAQSIQHLLKRMEITSSIANQWAEAMDILEHDTPDLVLLDMRMPNVDGPTLLQFVRESGYDVPVVVVSASLGEVDLDHLRELGVKRFVPKPFSVEQLKGIIEEQLKLAELGQKENEERPAGSDAAGEGRQTEHVLSSSKSATGHRWRPKASSRKKRRNQIWMIAIVCAGISLLALAAKMVISKTGIVTMIELALREQSEMKH